MNSNRAYIFGERAFVNKKERIPSLDIKLRELVKGCQTDEMATCMKEWVKGYDHQAAEEFKAILKGWAE